MALPKLSDEKRAWYILQGYVISVGFSGNWREWLLNCKLHRHDGPAVERADGSNEWWLNDYDMTEEEHQIAIQKLREERNNATY